MLRRGRRPRCGDGVAKPDIVGCVVRDGRGGTTSNDTVATASGKRRCTTVGSGGGALPTVVAAQAAILVSAAVWDTRTVLRLLWWGARVGG